MDEQCPFCAIARGMAPATIVYQDAATVAFFPDTPATPGHTLVIPRVHVTDYFAASPDVVKNVSATCLRVGRGLRRAVEPDGLNLITSAGEAATQSVFHLHMHVVPRFDGDHIGNIWPPKVDMPDAQEERLAEVVRSVLSMDRWE